jgi:REP element-mobilizing transposase RayT
MSRNKMNQPQRKQLRLPNFDYTNERPYFVTIVTQNRTCLFGRIIDGKMILNDAGKMVNTVCEEIQNFLSSVRISPYQIMPNHFHAIILIDFDHLAGVDYRVCLKEIQETSNDRISLSSVVKRFKSLTTRRYIDGVNEFNWMRFDKHLWQRGFYEHIIRNEKDYEAIVDYIEMNPQNWTEDEEYLQGL